jgi:HEAT repeat protein
MITVRWRVRTLMGLVVIVALSIKCVLYVRSKHLVSRLESETEKWLWDNRRDPYPGNPAKALKQIKLPADVIAPMLRTAMASQDPWVRLQATDVLCDAAERSGASDPVSTELLLAALQDREGLIRIRVPEALARLDDNTRRKAVDILVGQLRRPDRLGQLVAAIGLSQFGKEGQASAKVLTDRFRGGDVASRLWDLYLLGKIGPAAILSVPDVVREMTSPDAEKRVVLFVSNFWLIHTWHCVELDRILNSSEIILKSFNLCELGAVVVGRIGPEAERQAVDILVGMIRGDDESLRARAIAALGSLGPRAPTAIPTLLALAERKAPVRPGESDWQAELRLAKALERASTGGDPRLVAALIRMLKSSERAKRMGAATTLSDLKPPAPAAVPMLIKALKDDTQGVRYSAAVALGRYEEPQRGAALPALLGALQDEDEWVSCMAAKSLAYYRAGAPQAVPAIVKLLRSEKPILRGHAAKILGEFGPAASSAIPVLQKARHDADKFVREAAEKALEAVSPSETANPDE